MLRPKLTALGFVTFLFVSPLPAQVNDTASGGFTDPAPPRVAKLEAIETPAPESFEGLTFHRAAKPLDLNANVEDWPGFLGPRRDGRSRESHLLASWPAEGPDLVWEVDTGVGFGSPAIQAERLVFAHRIGDETLVDCLQTTSGKRYWRRRFPTHYSGTYIDNDGPPSTPMIDGERVYMHGVEGWLHCYELTTGRVLWKRNLQVDFEVPDGFFGVVTSPLVVGDYLIINLGSPRGPSVAAFDKHTGKLVWGQGSQWGMCCASPVMAQVHGRERLFVLAGGQSRPPVGGLMVLDPRTGALEFEFPFRSRTYTSVVGSSPVVVGSSVFLTAAYNTGTTALDLLPDGGFQQRWTNRRFGSEFANPLYVDGYLYAVDGIRDHAGGILCIDPTSGETIAQTELDWEETVRYQGSDRRMPWSIGNGSLLHADGRFYCLGDYGHLLALECTPSGTRVLARASLFRANQSWTPLVLSRGLLFVRQNNPEQPLGDHGPRLLCYDLRRRGGE